MFIIILVFIFASILLIASQIAPLVVGKINLFQEKKVNQAEKKLSNMFLDIKKERLILVYTLSPLLLGVAAFLFLHNLALSCAAAAVGFILPTLVIKKIEALRKFRFQTQLIDGIMMLSSSLRAGLSLLQAIEVLTEDMPAPLSQEFGLVLRENKMGVPLEESLIRMNNAMQLEELNLVINSILVAKETGGDLTKVLSRLCDTIRNSRKLKDTMTTLTLQGRIQGVIMSALPFVFTGWVITFNRAHFDIMLKTESGRTLLIVAAILQVLGMILIRKFSSLKA